MGRSTHSDRTTAWAAKQQKNFGYMTKKIVPSADEINQLANNSSLIKTKEEVDKVEAVKKED